MTRTCDLRFRKPLLYPAELRDRVNRDVAYGLRSCIRPAGSGKYLPMRAARIIGLIALFAAASAHPAHAEDEAPAACRLETLGVFIPGLAIDGRTFRLKDGRAVRLAGIEAAEGNTAKEALETSIAGGLVALRRGGSGTDRYGHLVAQVFALRDGAERWVQQEMIAGGQARVGARVGDPACASALLAAERAARNGHVGLWADTAYAIKQADDLAGLLADRGRFIVAEGKVLSVRQSGGTIYVNFGQVWSRNLTVTILQRSERAFAAAGMELKKLEGRRVRVRVWVEERGGPRIEAARPEQIEFADRN